MASEWTSTVAKYVASGIDDVVTEVGEPPAEQVPLLLEGLRDLPEEFIGLIEPDCHGGLERSAVDVGEELFDRANGGDERRRRTRPADLPSGDASVLPPLPIATVRSRMPGRPASGRCVLPSKSKCSYTSSVTTMRSRSTARSAMSWSSVPSKTFPVGLCGVLSKISLVRGVIAWRNSSASNVAPVAGTAQGYRPPTRARKGNARRVGVVVRLEHHDLIAGLGQAQDCGGDRLCRTRRHEDFGRGVIGEAVEPVLMARDRVPKLWYAQTGGY